MSQFTVRRTSLAIAVLVGIGSLAALVLDLGSDSMRWIVACGFAASILAFFSALVVGRGYSYPRAEPEELAEARMVAVRHAVLQQQMTVLQASHDRLEAQLKARASDPGASAADQIGARLGELESELATTLDENARLRAQLARADEAMKAAQADPAPARQIAQIERLTAERDAARTDERTARDRVGRLARETAELRTRSDESARAVAALETARERLATDAKEARAARDLAAAARDATAARVTELEGEASVLRSDEERLRDRLRQSMASTESATARRDASAEASLAAKHTADLDRLRGERDAALAAAAEAAQVAASLRSADAERSAAVAASVEELRAARARTAELQAQLAALETRASTAAAEAARIESAHAMLSQEIAALRTREAMNTSAAARDLADARSRADEAENAVRVALRELGADPESSALDAASVQSAMSPLSLYAFGEDTPGWRPAADDDTLAAAVIHLRRQADERLRQLQNSQAALDFAKRSS